MLINTIWTNWTHKGHYYGCRGIVLLVLASDCSFHNMKLGSGNQCLKVLGRHKN